MESRTAVVIGGSGGIGRSCAAALRERGYEVVLAARRREALEATARDIGARWIAADCSVEADVERLMDSVGDVAMLVHAAGILAGTRVSEQPVAVFDQVIQSNLRSAYLVTKTALRKMQAGARIVYISSTVGLKGMNGLSAYSASKAGINALAQTVAAEVEGDGIAVHVVTPAPVRTNMIDKESADIMWLLEPEDVARTLLWLDSMHPRVVVREVVLRSVVKGPFAPEPIGAAP